jgi:hypothetical protein
MSMSGLARNTGALDIVTHHLHAAQAKWSRLTASDYAAVKTARYLIAAVENRYGLPHGEAKRDVEIWLRDVGQAASPR